MDFGPFSNEASRATPQIPTNQPKGRYFHERRPVRVDGMKVRRRGIVAVHANDDPVEAAKLDRICTYNTYVANKTISVPDDVVPIIESLDVPFSRWVTDQLRRYAAQSTMSFADQLVADRALAAAAGFTPDDAMAVGERMERSASW